MLTKEESLSLEKELIDKLNPLFNKARVNDSRNTLMHRGVALKQFIYNTVLNCNLKNKSKRVDWCKELDTLFSIVTITDLIHGYKLPSNIRKKYYRKGVNIGKYIIFNKVFSLNEKMYLKFSDEILQEFGQEIVETPLQESNNGT